MRLARNPKLPGRRRDLGSRRGPRRASKEGSTGAADVTDSGRLGASAKPRTALVDMAAGRRSIVFRLDGELGRIEVVGQALELALTRLRDGEEPRDRPLGQPAELRTRCQYLADRSAVATER